MQPALAERGVRLPETSLLYDTPSLAAWFRFSPPPVRYRKDEAMPAFAIQVDHQLGQEVAVQRLKEFLEKISQKYKDQLSGMEGDWEGSRLTFKFKTYGFQISGTLDAEEESVKLDGQLPFAAVMFKGRIESSIRDEIVKLLS